MPWWLLVDAVEGFVYLVAFVMFIVFVVAWVYWLIKRQQERVWQKQFVADMLAEGRASMSAANAPLVEVEWDEKESGPKWKGETFKDYQQRWAEWYTTERKV